ncbi:MAG: 3'(2'),5'-bisphosphate nucleotidase CysQ [Candidatus Moranbacteria bacterium]|jgi:3'(2'), 5'-bisphosphate nucleotidase|nr:3'(2'),5'-bisphosphate nucleotidase CysQ [Candidatus Moranbacteria bacterium]
MHKIDIDKIIEISKEAGKIAMRFYGRDYLIEEKENKTPVTEADLNINDFLMKELSKFGYPILSEESEDDFEKRKEADYVWVIDPLDGTSDFVQKTGEFAIMIGLVENKTGESVLGVVFAPALKELYFGQKGRGSFMCHSEFISESQKITVSQKKLEGGKILVSRNHLGEYEQEVAKKYNVTQMPMGSAGLKICRIARGDAELYINSSDKSGIWDICAGDVILREAGGEIADLNKNIIFYNKKNIVLKHGYRVLNGFKF